MKFLFIIFLLVNNPLKADILSVHCPQGCPSNPEPNDLVFKHVYAFSNNATTKFADWVAYEVDVINFGASPGRNWRSDPLLADNETLEKGDYRGANTSNLKADRGHQAPLASFAGSRYWPELNILSNITPQNKDLNQGPWKALEDAVRKASEYRKSLFVITGPLYEGTALTLPGADEPHRVPSGYFKIVYDKNGHSASFIMQQTASRDDNYCAAQKSLAVIQSKVRFTLPSLSNSHEMALKLGC